MLIAARNAMMAGGKRLPYDAEVEFLESTGTQWIDTGYKPNSITEFSIVYKPAYYGTTFRCVYGVQGGNDRQRFYLVLSGSSAYKIQINSIANGSEYCGVNSNGTITDTINGNFAPDNRRVSVVVNNPQKRVVLNGVEYAMPNWWGVDLSCPHPLALFGRKSGEAIQTENLFIGKIERCHISENGVLVRDYIPVRKGTVGYLYDRVSGKLFGNAGTGDFVLGPDVVPVEYIESHGTEWIDTGVVPTTATAVKATVMPTNQSTSRFMFGCRMAINENTYACLLHWSNRIGYRVGNGGFVYTSDYSEVGVIHKYGIANGVFYRDGAVVSDGCIGASFNINCALALLAINTNGTYDQQFIGRLYSCAINNSSVPVRSFRPVRVGTDATSWEGAMMDVLTRRIYRNAGTGAFTFGNDLKHPIPAA